MGNPIVINRSYNQFYLHNGISYSGQTTSLLLKYDPDSKVIMKNTYNEIVNINT